jgi:glycine cleavage system regulatory protein
MKKSIFFGIIFAVLLISCKKENICTCTYTLGGVKQTKEFTYKMKEADAVAECDAKQKALKITADDAKCKIE